jgi:integrase/recombinase XerD
MCPRSLTEEKAMTPLRQRMLDALELRGMSPRTQRAYIEDVARLARHYKRSPDGLSATEVQQYLLHCLREQRLSRSSVNQYCSAFRFLYGTVLGLEPSEFEIPLAPAPQQLPEILSREELARLFAVAAYEKSRTFLEVAYGTGLRVSELCRLRVADIDSHRDRMCVRVEQGKGAKDRYVPLAEDVLEQLRRWWRAEQPRRWLFTGSRWPVKPLSVAAAQRWYRAACAQAGITKRGGIHTLRHCYATHMLEAGVDLHSLSQWLGHGHVNTTSRYLHLVRPDLPQGARREPLSLLRGLPAQRAQ